MVRIGTLKMRGLILGCPDNPNIADYASLPCNEPRSLWG
ncbi:hypothetical protein CLU84_0834 [Comamonas sp. 26]|nr:hypothetical protein CLU84_0834 [Comamonas sp. 26]